MVGVMQSYYLIRKERPNAVFIKGGFVGLPVGIAAHACRVPIITHDSDAVPGLANRILSRWAEVSAVAMPVSCYAGIYDSKKMQQTGLPIDASFAKLAHTSKQQLRSDLGLPQRRPMVLIIPGSSGAASINHAVVTIAADLIEAGCSIVHVTGRKHYPDITTAYQEQNIDQRYLAVRAFVDNPAEYTRAADVIVSRSGSMLLELAAQGCAVVSVPHPHLTGAHQLKNAELYRKARAAVVVDDMAVQKRPDMLKDAIAGLLKDANRRKQLGDALRSFYKPQAATLLAKLIIARAKK